MRIIHSENDLPLITIQFAILGLPDVLGAVTNGTSDGPGSKMYGNTNANQIYRVVGGRKHVQKSEAGMQTDTASAASASPGNSNSIKQPVQEHYDWKQVLLVNHTLPRSKCKLCFKKTLSEKETCQKRVF